MKVFFHRNFEKNHKKLRGGERERFKERLKIFMTDPFDPLLGNHPLRGKYQGCRSINIGGDLRAVYKALSADASLFVAIDTHDKLYK